jgi:metallo-beta-lactamase family protein
MLGGGVVNLEIIEDGTPKRIAYTGDIGRPTNRVLGPPELFPQADFLIAESTYGDRLHSTIDNSENELLDILYKTCVVKKGKLIIPSFSVGRTQEIVYSLNNFYNAGKLPKIDIYVDSPMAVNATDIFRLHPECFNESILEVMETDPDPFGFNSLFYIKQQEDSKRLNQIKKPCVIISASGMMEAGRVKHHIANSISDPNNTILAVGYCAPSTLGARILRGDKIVSIHGHEYVVKAEIRRIDSFSGHGDYSEMIDFLSCQDKDKLKQVFIVHGEFEAQQAYKIKLEAEGYTNIKIPDVGDEFSY